MNAPNYPSQASTTTHVQGAAAPRQPSQNPATVQPSHGDAAHPQPSTVPAPLPATPTPFPRSTLPTSRTMLNFTVRQELQPPARAQNPGMHPVHILEAGQEAALQYTIHKAMNPDRLKINSKVESTIRTNRSHAVCAWKWMEAMLTEVRACLCASTPTLLATSFVSLVVEFIVLHLLALCSQCIYLNDMVLVYAGCGQSEKTIVKEGEYNQALEISRNIHSLLLVRISQAVQQHYNYLKTIGKAPSKPLSIKSVKEAKDSPATKALKVSSFKTLEERLVNWLGRRGVHDILQSMPAWRTQHEARPAGPA
jgi:hypothetical protein